MAKTIISYEEYLDLLTECISLHKGYNNESTLKLLNKALEPTHNSVSKTIMVDDYLLRNIAIANLCSMALIQLRDSNGEIDYAGLGNHSEEVLNHILKNI